MSHLKLCLNGAFKIAIINITMIAAELKPNISDLSLIILNLSLILLLFLNPSRGVNELVGLQTELYLFFFFFIPVGTLFLQSIEIQAITHTHAHTHTQKHTHTHRHLIKAHIFCTV